MSRIKPAVLNMCSMDLLDRASKANPAAVQPRLLTARYYLGNNQPQKALNFANEAALAQPDDPEALGMLGTVQLAAGENENALATFQQLVQQIPESPLGYFSVASAQSALERFSAARTSLNKALELNPNYVDAQNALVLLDVREGKYAEAQKIAQQIQKKYPKSALGLTLEGHILMAQKQYSQAARSYESASNLQESWALATNIYKAYNKAGTRQKGEERIIKWLKERPKDEVARLYLAQAYMLTGQNKAAIEQFQMLLQQEPSNAVILNDLAWLFQQEKDARALEFAERAYKLKPDSSFILDTLGWILTEQGKLQRAQELIRKGLTLDPKNIGIKYHLAVTLAKSGDKDGARKLLEELIASREDFPQLKEAKILLDQL